PRSGCRVGHGNDGGGDDVVKGRRGDAETRITEPQATRVARRTRRCAAVAGATLALAMAIGACGGSEGDSQADNAAAGAKEGGHKAVLIAVQKRGDKGPIDSMIGAMKKGQEEFGFDEIKDVYAPDPSQAEQALRQFSQAGYDLLITTFSPPQE